MSRTGSIRRSLAWVSLAALLVRVAPSAAAPACRSGPLPENADNRVVLCSPDPDSLVVTISSEGGLQIEWDAPPRAETAYTSPPLAVRWQGLAENDTVPSIELRGTYLAIRDRRVQFDVASVDSLGTSIPNGTVGRHRIRVTWTSVYEASTSGAVAGVFDLLPSYAGEGLRFDVQNPNPVFPPDTTRLAGLRVAFQIGARLKVQDAAVFDVEDFEGWHVWRWGADPTSRNYTAAGEYSKLADVSSPNPSWPDATPDMRRVRFVDRNVFNGFTYHYAITTYDQGFRRATSGTDLAVKFDSPFERAIQNPDGSYTLGTSQRAVPYSNVPPESFQPIAAVPNPFREAEADPNVPESQIVHFISAPARGTLLIWTVAGDLVHRQEQNAPDTGTMDWDTRNQSGEKVASGVYIYKIIDLNSGQESYGRLAIIR